MYTLKGTIKLIRTCSFNLTIYSKYAFGGLILYEFISMYLATELQSLCIDRCAGWQDTNTSFGLFFEECGGKHFFEKKQGKIDIT